MSGDSADGLAWRSTRPLVDGEGASRNGPGALRSSRSTMRKVAKTRRALGVLGERRVRIVQQRERELGLRVRISGAAHLGVLQGELLVEPTVWLAAAVGPGDRFLEEWDCLVGSTERAQSLSDAESGECDRRRIFRKVRRAASARSKTPEHCRIGQRRSAPTRGC